MILKRPARKAYHMSSVSGTDYSTIVFAESPAKAKVAALFCDTFEDERYIDLRARRLPEADCLYRGYSEIDWYDADTRIALVRDFGWQCYETSHECCGCPAKPWCGWYEEKQA